MTSKPEYRQGDSLVCPNCGKESVVKHFRKMDGWTFIGEFLVCALCEAELQQVDNAGASRVADEETSVNALADFFGTALDKPAPLATESANFCRDCTHYYKNPFTSQCMLHERKVEPMHDCTDFSMRPIDNAAGDGATTS